MYENNDLPSVEVVSTGGVSFNYLKNNSADINSGPELPEVVTEKATKKRGRPKGSGSTGIIRVEAEVVNPSTLDTYQENMMALKGTIQQVDILAGDLKQDLDSVRAARTMKGKYQYTSLIASNLSTLLSTKVMAIREMNTTIKNSNELDYRREKDRKEMEAGDDDRAIQNLYNAFISAPVNQGGGRDILGPNTQQMSLNGSTGIVRSGNNSIADNGYQNFISNITPEQNMMRYENNPNIQTVVVYDAQTGAKYFDVMDVKTRQSIPNVPRRDNMFLEDTTIDTRNRIARNINLNETYPLIILNEGSASEY